MKTRCPQYLGWSGLAGAPWAGPLPGITRRERRAPGRRPALPIAPSLSHSAMAVESFTATAPFVQIGRFFLSAGESLAPSDEPAAPRGPVFLLGHLLGAGVPAALGGCGISLHGPGVVRWAGGQREDRSPGGGGLV